MENESLMLKCSLVRGGTSKAVFIMKNELPADPVLRDKIILALYGSPDLRQIDGLGGADLLTSKLAIISPSTIPEADVDYTFGQVSLVNPLVDYNGTCGNISSAVGPYAINNGLVPAVEPYTTVRINLTNVNRVIIARVPVRNGKALVEGDFSIDGVPGTGAKISLDWSRVVGGKTGRILPTGRVQDQINVDGKIFNVSIVDAGTLTVFIRAEELGMKGTETPQQIDSNSKLVNAIESVRGRAAQLLGFVNNWEDARTLTPYMPFTAIVSRAASYDCFTGKHVNEKDVDFVSRLTSMQVVNKTYALSGAVSTAVAARTKGSVVWDLLSREAREKSMINIGHPSGVIPVEAIAEYTNQIEPVMKTINIYRTARIIMEGYAYIRKSSIEK